MHSYIYVHPCIPTYIHACIHAYIHKSIASYIGAGIIAMGQHHYLKEGVLLMIYYLVNQLSSLVYCSGKLRS